MSADAPAKEGFETQRSQCIGWMMSDYPTGLDENWCVAQFSLPSAFIIKCAQAQVTGYASLGQREACRVMFERAARETETGYVLN